MSSSDSLAVARTETSHRWHRDLRRRALVFAVLGLLICIALVAALEPPGQPESHTRTIDLLARVQAGGSRFEWSHAPGLVAVGASAGLLAGMLGMGGGVLKVAGMLVVFQLDMLLARAVSLITMLLATASAARVHYRQRTVLWQVARPMLFPAIVGTLGGLLLGNVLPRATMIHFFGFFTLFLGLNTLAQSFGDPHEYTFSERYPKYLDGARKVACAAIGALHGFVCGLLGISGGVVTMPMQQALVSVPARNAVANSVLVSAVCTSFGSIAAVGSGLLRGDFQISDVVFASSCIGGGAILGAQLGARLTGMIPVLVLKLMFVQVTIFAAMMILFR